MVRFRRAAQILSALAMNANLPGLVTGRIWQGQSKRVCVPGLNCYSCPAAVGACPLGALQFALASGEWASTVYVLGAMLAFGAVLGRAVCGFLCPFGLIQELISAPFGKMISRRRAVVREGRRSLARFPVRNLNYIFLIVFVIVFPLTAYAATGLGDPAFCKYICPAGTFEAGLPLVSLNAQLRASAGSLFGWKLLVMLGFLAACFFIYRPFCRICPLGAVYGLCNKTAAVGMTVDGGKCTRCGGCSAACPMQTGCGSRECVRCGRCVSECPSGAVRFTVLGK